MSIADKQELSKLPVTSRLLTLAVEYGSGVKQPILLTALRRTDATTNGLCPLPAQHLVKVLRILLVSADTASCLLISTLPARGDCTDTRPTLTYVWGMHCTGPCSALKLSLNLQDSYEDVR